ncbi:cyclic AMP-dependent transcription factor ATF-2-like [Saccoglossus kowalevskii]
MMKSIVLLKTRSMSSDDKPFACTATGCTQRFTNEDHLTVHKQKHEMTLKFGPPKFGDGTLPVADQTPTPTRFLRNCEEVGLFQELPNVNPFEHEFKKASEKQFADKEALESGIVSASTLVIKIPTVESPLSSTVETMATDSVGSTSNNTMSSPDTVSTTTNEDEVAAVHSTMQEPVTVATPISISSITTQAPSQLFAQVHHG